MKKILSLALLACISMALCGQSKGNSSYLKILVVNENNDLLMVRHKGNWEPIGGAYSSQLPIEDFVEEMGSVFEQIQGNEDLWSGSWYILKNAETRERKFEKKKDFFKLN